MKNFLMSFIGFKGRLNRKAYMIRILLLLAVVASGLLFRIFHLINMEPDLLDDRTAFFRELFNSDGLGVFLLVLSVVYTMLTVRRFHDCGWSGWAAGGLWLVTMTASFWFPDEIGRNIRMGVFFVPFFLPGINGANRYGPGNSTADDNIPQGRT